MVKKNKQPPEIVYDLEPMDERSTWLQEKYYENLVGQSERMDQLGYKLITLELAIPGLLVTVLKLSAGKGKPILTSPGMFFAFIFWFLALFFTLLAVFPKTYKVDPSIIERDSPDRQKTLSIYEYFHYSAKDKKHRLIPGIFFFTIGVICSFVSLIQL